MKVVNVDGCGLTFLGAKRSQKGDYHLATVWLTIVYIPLIPLRRYRVRFGPNDEYTILSKTSLRTKEILACYLWCWIFLPISVVGPVFLGLKEVWQGMGWPPSLQIPYILLAIGWICVAVWKLADRYERSKL